MRLETRVCLDTQALYQVSKLRTFFLLRTPQTQLAALLIRFRKVTLDLQPNVTAPFSKKSLTQTLIAVSCKTQSCKLRETLLNTQYWKTSNIRSSEKSTYKATLLH